MTACYVPLGDSISIGDYAGGAVRQCAWIPASWPSGLGRSVAIAGG
jgi:hypothetical protein